MAKVKKWRGWYCRICHKYRPNEAFSGRGRTIHICKKCKLKPKDKIQEIITLDVLNKIFEQKNISPGNLKQLQEMIKSENLKIRNLAEVLFKIGQVYPHRRKRFGFIKFNHPDLWARMIEIGLILPDEIFENDSEELEEDIDFNNLCEYAEVEIEKHFENEINDENIEENECPF